jgi:hypothetical protein
MADERWSKSNWDAMRAASDAILKGTVPIGARGHGPKCDPLTDNVRDLIVRAFARTGKHADTTRLIFPRGVPADIQRDCQYARSIILANAEA